MNSINLISDLDSVRIDSWLTSKLKDYSRSHLQKIIEQGFVSVNGKKVKSNYKLKLGQQVQITMPEIQEQSIEPEDIPLKIIYEDEHLLVVDKPKGMVVHPATGNYSGTLVNAILNYCGDTLSDINGEIRPGIIHRLDKDTTGVLVVAKTNEAHSNISKKLKEHKVKRVYVALVQGVITEKMGRIEMPIGRHPVDRKKMSVNIKNGKNAITYFTVIERFDDSTYIELSLETGRTHQIRVHMSHIGHPILGDLVYGCKRKQYIKEGQALHAKLLGFEHPITKTYMEFEAPIPEYFVKLLKGRKMSNKQS